LEKPAKIAEAALAANPFFSVDIMLSGKVHQSLDLAFEHLDVTESDRASGVGDPLTNGATLPRSGCDAALQDLHPDE